MKKLLSAATSICMAASMLTSIPAVVNAADEDTTKGMSLRAVDMSNLSSMGSTITVPESAVANGDYTFTCGLYVEEQYPTSGGIIAKFGITDKCADDTAISIKRHEGEVNGADGNLNTDPTADFFATAKSYTTKNGTEFSTKMLPTWTGTVARKTLKPNATNCFYTHETDMTHWGVQYPLLVFNWISIKNDPWLGATSDEFPMCYFDVTLKKGAKAGKYYVDIYDYWENDQKTQRCSQIGSGVTTNLFFRTVDVNGSLPLTLKGLEITVGDGKVDPTTPPTTTQAPTPAPTTKPVEPVPGDGIDLTWLYPDGKDCYEVNAGDTEIYADLLIDTHGNEIMGVDMGFNADEGIKVDEIWDSSEAFNNKGLTVNWVGNPAAQDIPRDKEGNPITAKFNGVMGNTIGAGDEAQFVAQVPATDLPFVTLVLSVPAGTPDGYYKITAPYIEMTKDRNNTKYQKFNYQDCIIKVGNPDDIQPTTVPTTTQAPTTQAPTTVAPTTAAPTTQAPTKAPTTAKPGTRLLGDTNCDGTVNVADVVILNKYIATKKNLMTDQGMINGEVTNPTLDLNKVDLTGEDSKAILWAIIDLYTLTDEGPKATEYLDK